MSKETELLPCPFCGCALEAHWRRANPKAMCRTEGCVGAKLPILNLDQPEAIAAWNTRSADRELRRGDALDISAESVEKQAANVQMPVIAWVEPEYEDHFGCDSIQAYRSEKPGWEALVRQSDVQVALVAKDAEIDVLKADYLRACQTVAAMHEAATGRVGEAPWLGVVEDVAALKAERDALKVAAEGECKPSLYLFLSEHGSIRYWTRDADAAARKAIEFGAEPERFYATPVPAPVQTAAQYLSGSDMADLQQLDADFSDGEGWCLPKARMTRLAELGVIRHGGGGHYSITSFGRLILGEEFSRLPLETVEECNARIGKEHNAITAQ